MNDFNKELKESKHFEKFKNWHIRNKELDKPIRINISNTEQNIQWFLLQDFNSQRGWIEEFGREELDIHIKPEPKLTQNRQYRFHIYIPVGGGSIREMTFIEDKQRFIQSKDYNEGLQEAILLMMNN